jgi:hypothetical protein
MEDGDGPMEAVWRHVSLAARWLLLLLWVSKHCQKIGTVQLQVIASAKIENVRIKSEKPR